MYHIIGLKNSGQEYKNTPHNIGGEVLEMIAEEINGNVIQSKTYMNNSGDNPNNDIRQGDSEELIVVHDDIDMEFGKIKIAFDKNDGGHKGVQDIIQKMRTKKIIRIKIGVRPLDFFGYCRKPKKENLNGYLVYKKLSKRYLNKYSAISEEVQKIIETIIADGHQVAMNKFN